MVAKYLIFLLIIVSTLAMAQTPSESIAQVESEHNVMCVKVSESFKKCINYYCFNKQTFACESEETVFKAILSVSYKTGSDGVTIEKVKKRKIIK